MKNNKRVNLNLEMKKNLKVYLVQIKMIQEHFFEANDSQFIRKNRL